MIKWIVLCRFGTPRACFRILLQKTIGDRMNNRENFYFEKVTFENKTIESGQTDI